MKLTNADGCSIYLIEQIPDTSRTEQLPANKQMRFHSALNLSRDTSQLQEQVLPLDFSTVMPTWHAPASRFGSTMCTNYMILI